MKNLTAIAMGVVFAVLSFHSAAQTQNIPLNEPDRNKPKLFADLPQKLDLRIADLDVLFSLPVGSEVNALIASGFHFRGNVVSKSDANDPSVKSIVLRSSNRLGAVFTFTKRMEEDGTTVYLGRIISMKHSDAYEISFEKDGYILTKTDLYELVSE